MSILKYINIYILILFLILSSSQEQYEDDKHKIEDDIPPLDKPDKNKNKKFDDNLNDMNNLKKKYESIIKENNNSKEKLKKYNFYYYTFEILNIIFALFIFTYFMNQIFKFYKFRYNIQVNQENSVSNVEIKNNFNKHLWFSGRIRAYQAREPGSIPGGCKLFFSLFIIEIHSFFWLIIHKG